MKVKYTDDDVEALIQKLIDSGEPWPDAEELGIGKKQYQALKEKFDLSAGDEFGAFWL